MVARLLRFTRPQRTTHKRGPTEARGRPIAVAFRRPAYGMADPNAAYLLQSTDDLPVFEPQYLVGEIDECFVMGGDERSDLLGVHNG